MDGVEFSCQTWSFWVFSGRYAQTVVFTIKVVLSSETDAVQFSDQTWSFWAFLGRFARRLISIQASGICRLKQTLLNFRIELGVFGRFAQRAVSTQTNGIFCPKRAQLNFRVKCGLFGPFADVLLKRSFPPKK